MRSIHLINLMAPIVKNFILIKEIIDSDGQIKKRTFRRTKIFDVCLILSLIMLVNVKYIFYWN
jgi:hypothetical protein